MKKNNLGVIFIIVIVIIAVALFGYSMFTKDKEEENKVGNVVLKFDDDNEHIEDSPSVVVDEEKRETFGEEDLPEEMQEVEEEKPFGYEDNADNELESELDENGENYAESVGSDDEMFKGEEFVIVIRSFLMGDNIEEYKEYFEDDFYDENIGKLTIPYKNYLYADNELHNPVMKVIPFNADDEHYYNVMYTLNSEGKVNSITIVEADSSIWGGYHIDSNGKIIYD